MKTWDLKHQAIHTIFLHGAKKNRNALISMEKRTLDNAKKGKYFTILGLPQGMVKVQMIRLGISEGDRIFCLERLPGGTVVIQKNRQEIAMGYELARQILISEDL